MVTLEEFKRLEIKVAKIIEVKDHPNADKLYILKIDFGDKEKQIVAGIKPTYTKEELIDKQIVVIDNLEPAVIRGMESQGMLLAVEDEKGPVLVVPERLVKAGSKIR